MFMGEIQGSHIEDEDLVQEFTDYFQQIPGSELEKGVETGIRPQEIILRLKSGGFLFEWGERENAVLFDKNFKIIGKLPLNLTYDEIYRKLSELKYADKNRRFPILR